MSVGHWHHLFTPGSEGKVENKMASNRVKVKLKIFGFETGCPHVTFSFIPPGWTFLKIFSYKAHSAIIFNRHPEHEACWSDESHD